MNPYMVRGKMIEITVEGFPGRISGEILGNLGDTFEENPERLK